MRRSQRLIQKAKNKIPPILRLNHDCLAQIFFFLTLKERIKLTRVCKEWKAFVELWPWTDIKELKISFETDNDKHKIKYTLPILKQVLGYCGKFITSLSIGFWKEKGCDESVMKSIVKLCPNLKSIDMLQMELYSSVAELLAESYTNLIHIAIGNCQKGCTEAITKLFSNNQLLQAVEFQNIELEGRCLLQLPGESIESLTFSYGCKFSGLDVLKVFRNLKKLKTLSITDVPAFNENLNDLLGVLPNKLNLENLILSHYCKHSPIEFISTPNMCHFTNLRKLTLKMDSLHDELATFIGKNCKLLSHVHLSECYALTDFGLKNLLDKSQIQELYLDCLEGISEKSFKDISMPSLKIFQFFDLFQWTNESLRLCMIASPNLSRFEVAFCDNVDVDTLIEDALHYSSNRSSQDVLNLDIEHFDLVSETRIISPRLIVTLGE